MKITSKNNYDEVVNGLLEMMHQTIVVRLPAHRKDNRPYEKSTFAGVLSSFNILKESNSECLVIDISLEESGQVMPFQLSGFEIALVPSRNSTKF